MTTPLRPLRWITLASLAALASATACSSDSEEKGEPGDASSEAGGGIAGAGSDGGGAAGTAGGGGALGGTGGTGGGAGGGGGGAAAAAGASGTIGWDASPDGPVQISDGGVVITEDGGTTFVCYPTSCAGHVLECGDCQDDDGDGRVDWRDPECLGPCDNSEGPGLDSAVGGTVGASCGVDCYFDFGNGPGNDDCHWDHRCDPLNPEAPACSYEPGRVGGSDCPATQSQKCEDYCKPYTPNGCDCFGCCTFPALANSGDGGAPLYVWIGTLDSSNASTCTLADVADPDKCRPCTPAGNCLNECGRCEICVGKPEVPEDCYAPPDAGSGGSAGTGGSAGVAGAAGSGGTGGYPGQCPVGITPCGLPGQAACTADEYCLTGCCRPAPQ